MVSTTFTVGGSLTGLAVTGGQSVVLQNNGGDTLSVAANGAFTFSHKVAKDKTYLATVVGAVPRGLGKTLRAGVELDDGPVHVDDFAVVDAVPGKSLLRVTRNW